MQSVKEPHPTPLEKLCRGQLAESELAEIRGNLVGFFDVLVEIDREEKEKENHATDDH